MNVSRVIALANSLRPNTIDEELKVSFIYELEADIAEMMGEKLPENTWPQEDRKLLLPFPHDNAYILYLCAKIDHVNEESALYMNDMVVANSAIAQARAWWRRHNLPTGKQAWKV